MESVILGMCLYFGLYTQSKKNQAARNRYEPQVDKRFAYVAENGICYVYEPNYHQEVWYATKVIRSEKAKKYVPIHMPIFDNYEEESYGN